MGKRRANAVIQNPNGELVCLVDSDKDVSKIANDLGCDFCQSYREAIEREDIDAVVVAVPNNLHARISIDSMNKGKHVFCEKPLARNGDEAKSMVEASIRNSVYLKAGSNVRFFKNILKAKEIIDNAELGDILFTRSWIGHGGWNLKKESWFLDPNQVGGGTLLDNGCHLVDILRWFTGEIRECLGYCSTLFHPIKDLEDNAMAILIGENNVPSFLQSSWMEWNGYLYMEVYGQKGVLRVDNRGENDKTILDFIGTSQPKIFDYSKSPKTSFKDEIDNFIEYVQANKQPQPTGYDGMRAVQIIEGIYESAKTGSRVKVLSDDDVRLKKMLNARPC